MTPSSRLYSCCAVAAILGAAFGGPAADARAVAAAAGTAFEAAPFVLAASLAAAFARRRPGRFANLRFLELAGCGCAGGRVPGALAVPAIALAALAFGPAVALARTGVALAIVGWRRRPLAGGSAYAAEPGADPLAELERLCACAFLASLAVAALGAEASTLPGPALALAGMLAGALAPCATAGVAVASALAPAAPAAAAGVLLTAGFVSVAPARLRGPGTPVPARAAFGTLAVALAMLACRGPGGLVNPRLLVPIALASAIAAVLAALGARSASAAPLLVPLAMVGVLLVPPQPPVPRADATRLDDAYAGEPLTFTGVAHRSRDRTTLARLAITCCRLDASPISVTLDAASRVAEGSWQRASGTLVRDGSGALLLHATAIRRTAVPADPFVYR